MADNLSVAVTADTSELRAQLALAQSDLKAFGADMRKLAGDIRSSGDTSASSNGSTPKRRSTRRSSTGAPG